MALRTRRRPPTAIRPAGRRGWIGVAAAITLAVAAALPAQNRARADTFTPAQRKQIDSAIHDYLVNHPAELLGAIQAAEEKMKSEAHERAEKALVKRHRDVFDDPATPVGGDPHGDVSLVEFFDYQCPYCKEVEPALEKLIAQDHRLRVVYKEFPVLGPVSVTAARAALAAKKQGKYGTFHDAMMAAKGHITDDTVFAVAKSVGLDVGKLKHDMADPEITRQIKGDLDLADQLDITGTPGFIIGNEIIPGAVDLDTLKQLIADAREK